MPTDADWARLAGLLITRRIDMDPAFANRRTFAAARRVSYRVIGDFENERPVSERARPMNPERATKAAVEYAYWLRPGAINHALAGGPLLLRDGEWRKEQKPEAEPDDDDLADRRELREARAQLREALDRLDDIEQRRAR